MFVTLAGAMSTAELGRSLADMIRADKVQAISCTGANLEEGIFSLIGRPYYLPLPKYRDLTPAGEQQLYDAGFNRVTDSGVPDDKAVMPLTLAVIEEWKIADARGERYFPHEFLYNILRNETLKHLYKENLADCWLYAAMEKNLPIIVPGWEDSTLGNVFAAQWLMGVIHNINTVRSGIEYMASLATWYVRESAERSIGFFQIGGGIAGDFPICVVPMLHEELKRDDVPLWGYFCQITDAVTSYGGYSGALPNEKITWGKLAEGTPSFAIESDATIVAPLIFALVLGW